jgi:hypothetical protein
MNGIPADDGTRSPDESPAVGGPPAGDAVIPRQLATGTGSFVAAKGTAPAAQRSGSRARARFPAARVPPRMSGTTTPDPAVSGGWESGSRPAAAHRRCAVMTRPRRRGRAIVTGIPHPRNVGQQVEHVAPAESGRASRHRWTRRRRRYPLRGRRTRSRTGSDLRRWQGGVARVDAAPPGGDQLSRAQLPPAVGH